MKKKPKTEGSVYLKGSDGKTYTGHVQQGMLFSNAPGWVTYEGWRKSLPNSGVLVQKITQVVKGGSK